MTEYDHLKELLIDYDLDLSYEGDEYNGFTTVHRELYDKRRWSMVYEIVTRTPTGRYYRWYLDVGATEYQDSDGFLGELEEVEPYTVKSTGYRRVSD